MTACTSSPEDGRSSARNQERKHAAIVKLQGVVTNAASLARRPIFSFEGTAGRAGWLSRMYRSDEDNMQQTARTCRNRRLAVLGQ